MSKFFIAPINWKCQRVGQIYLQKWNLKSKSLQFLLILTIKGNIQPCSELAKPCSELATGNISISFWNFQIISSPCESWAKVQPKSTLNSNLVGASRSLILTLLSHKCTTHVAEQGWIWTLGSDQFFEKNTINVFFFTNLLEIVYSGANLPSELKFDEKRFYWMLP